MTFSRNQIKNAGKILRDKDFQTVSKVKSAQDILTYWRTIHEDVIRDFHKIVSEKVKKISKDAFVAQRLKRTPSIIAKLKRLENIRLTTMQDIAGIRVVVSNMRELKILLKEIKNSIIHHELKDEDDYVVNPKNSGYRSIHLIYKYKNASKNELNNLLVEIQLRTKLQHTWATAVETMGTYLGTILKFDEGQLKWLNYFSLTSSAFSFLENTPQVSKHKKLSKFDTFELALYEFNYNKIAENLKAFSVLTKFICEQSEEKDKYYLMMLDLKKMLVTIDSFKDGEFELANKKYTDLEKKHLNNPLKQIVLVSTESVHELRDAYPNYFLDTDEFITNMSKVRKSFNRMKHLKTLITLDKIKQ